MESTGDKIQNFGSFQPAKALDPEFPAKAEVGPGKSGIVTEGAVFGTAADIKQAWGHIGIIGGF